jgi:hypothetical protein
MIQKTKVSLGCFPASSSAIFLGVFGFYLVFAWLVSGPGDWLGLDVVDGRKLFFIDDPHRFFRAQTAFQDPELYNWNFYLPVALLFDGILSALLGNNIFLIRVFHALLATTALFLLYRSGAHLGLRRHTLLCALAVAGFMPLYFVAYISFFGQVWLAFLVVLAILFLVKGWQLALAAVISVFPLVRPEGIFFTFSFALYFALRREWLCFMIIGFPGFVYLIWLLVSLDHPSIYFRWRTEWRDMLNAAVGDVKARPPWHIVSTFNLFWFLPSALMLISKPVRPIWPISLGAFIWVAYFFALYPFGLNSYLASYFLFLVPVLTLGWAVALQYIASTLPEHVGVRALPMILSVVVLAEHSFQLDRIRDSLGVEGRWPVDARPINLPEGMDGLTKSAREHYHDILDVLYREQENRPAPELLMIQDYRFFYFLDPDKLRPGMKVVYLTTSAAEAITLLPGLFFSMRPDDNQYSYFRLNNRPYTSERTAFYLGDLRLAGWQPVVAREFESLAPAGLYHVGFREIDWDAGS